jgi:hypothetical protein
MAMGSRAGLLSLALAACAGAQGPAASTAELPLPAPPPGAGEAAAVTARLGPPRALLESGRFGLKYYPDMAPTVLSPPPRLRMLVAAATSTALLEGTSLENLTAGRPDVLVPGGKGSPDNGYAGVSGAVAVGATTYAVYHGEDQEGLPKLAGSDGIPGFHASVGLAATTDGGRSFTKLGLAVTSAKAKGWQAYPGQADSGAGEPWILRSHDGAWWYLYYTEHSRVDGRGVQICMARAPASAPPAPGVFRKLYQGGFTEPGLGGRDTPLLNAQAFDQGESLAPQVVYSPALGLYVMVFNLDVWKEFVEKKGLRRSGVYLATSKDGVRWSRPEPLLIDWSVAQVGQSVTWHPAIVFDPGSSTEGWLLYGHTGRWGPSTGGTPHHLWGRRITLQRR